MKKDMNFYTMEEVEDKVIGKKGTPRRDAYEEDIALFRVGNALREARKSRNLTQEQLGKLVGVQKAQISKIENGQNVTLSTVVRYLKAIGVKANLNIKSVGDFSLA